MEAIVRKPAVMTREQRNRRAAHWCLALLGAAALLALHAPAILCLAATVGVAAWWCREQDASR
jgi:hypothetical protein